MSENTERRYLKWYNKIGYGSGDVAGNVVYAFLSSFVMIYLTDTVGLNPGIVGTLIAVSKLFDGITDIFFGSMIDKTHSKLGKARPWMLYGYIGCAITLVGIFAIPMAMSEFAKYAWFFICYSLLNAVFYTANNIAYSALPPLSPGTAPGVSRWVPIDSCSRSPPACHPVHHTAGGLRAGRHWRSLAHCGYRLRYYRSDRQHALFFLRQGTAGGRTGQYLG